MTSRWVQPCIVRAWEICDGDVGGDMDSIEDALAWLFIKSEDEILADVEIAALYDMFFEVES
jgi:hypothetical protein